MKNIRSKYVKESLLDYENLTKSLKENTASAVRDLLSEAVRDTYNQILAESDEYDEEEVEDTDSEQPSMDSNDTEENDESGEKEYNVADDDETEETDEPTEESTEEVTPDGAVEKTTVGSDGQGNEWSEFEKYKVSDDEYDLTNAEDDEIVKAYKLMKDDDQVVVTKNDNGMVHLQDNETGADYLIDLGSVPEVDSFEDDEEEGSEDAVEKTDNFDAEDEEELDGYADDENEDDYNMNEQRIFEIALDEYDSHVGYTDNYQKKDVMTNPGMSEPAKSSSTNDWDAGVPKGTEKPWSKQKKSVAPFNGAKGKTVEESAEFECGAMEEDDMSTLVNQVGDVPTVEEHVHRGAKKRMMGVKSHNTNSEGGEKNQGGSHHSSVAGEYNGNVQFESMVKKANAIYEENLELKKALKNFKAVLQEAAVTNVNLGQIIKLISENTTTMDEKKEIIARFGSDAKTVEQSKSLYESISKELKKKNKMNINEDKQFTANSSKMINEKQIYQSKDLLESLSMMHKVCKL